MGKRRQTSIVGSMLRMVFVVLSATALLACGQLREDLRKAEGDYDAARYENALVWLDDLERDTPSMDEQMRARFYYLRGMTAYRLNRRTEALHYLALAREVAGEQGVGLREQWRSALEGTLEELTPTTATHVARPAPDAETTSSSGTAQ